LTSKGRSYPTRVDCRFDKKDGEIVLDQILTVDKARLINKLGRLAETTQKDVLDGLAEMFAR
jgi:mRNA interferase MazF